MVTEGPATAAAGADTGRSELARVRTILRDELNTSAADYVALMKYF